MQNSGSFFSIVVPKTASSTAETSMDSGAKKRPPGETGSPNDLKTEFAERIRRGKVRYILQIQLHDPVPGESDEIFNCNVQWDPETHPYHDLATVELDSVVSLDENLSMALRNSRTPSGHDRPAQHSMRRPIAATDKTQAWCVLA